MKMAQASFVYLNGNIVRAEQAVVSIFDHGFLYGAGVFETFRAYNERPFLFDAHMDRLFAGLGELGIRLRQDRTQLKEAVLRTLAANRLQDAYIRLSVTGGEAGLGLSGEDYTSPTVLVMAKPVPPFPEAMYEKGKRLVTVSIPRNTPEGRVRHKSHNFLNQIFAKKELGAQEDAEGLMLTREGFVAEGIVSNIFLIRNGRLVTPTLATGILPGVTRAFVLRLASELGIPAEERDFRRAELLAADEIFLTNSIQEIVPVREVDGVTVGAGQRGPITHLLQQAYRNYAQTGEC
ncbi:aminodeoxychorismate lyase [Bacillaceae bacterium]